MYHRQFSAAGELACVAATVCCLFAFVSAAQAEVKWHEAAEPATEELTKEFNAAPVLVVYFGADWCKWCTKMNAEVFETDAFQALGSKAYWIEFDDKHDDTSDRVNVESNLKIESYPTIVVLKKDPNDGAKRVETGRLIGYKDVKTTMDFLKGQLGVTEDYVPPGPFQIPGGLLTPNANQCPPGDVLCEFNKASKKQPAPAESFDLQKALEAARIIADALPPEKGVTADDTNLPEMLREAGYMPERRETPEGTAYYSIVHKDGGWTYSLTTILNSTKKRIWFSMVLTKKLDVERMPASSLTALLNYNRAYGPAHFNLVDGALELSLAIDNVNITPGRLQEAIRDMESATRETSAVWLGMREFEIKQ